MVNPAIRPAPGADILAETVIEIAAASSLIPGRPHRSAMHRAITRGWRGIRLESFRLGKRRFTSEEAVRRFLERLIAADPLNTSPTASSPAAPAGREAAVRQALDRAGL